MNDMVKMIFITFCFFVHWTNVASAAEGLTHREPCAGGKHVDYGHGRVSITQPGHTAPSGGENRNCPYIRMCNIVS